MTPYIGCETAREILGGFLDGELVLADQVAVESHLRWCRPCAELLEDLQLIGASLRGGSPVAMCAAAPDLAAMQSEVLARVRAEHDQSWPVCLRALCEDMRFFWPAVGASVALAASLCVALAVLQAATAEDPASLASMIERLERPVPRSLAPATPGSDHNPLRLDNRVSFPRPLDGISALEALSEDEVAFAVSAVVTREGRIAAYDLLAPADGRAGVARTARAEGEMLAVLDGVRRSRFAPAEAAGGTKVAVNMVWLLVRTTAKVAAKTVARPAPPKPDAALPDANKSAPAEPATDVPAVNRTTA